MPFKIEFPLKRIKILTYIWESWQKKMQMNAWHPLPLCNYWELVHQDKQLVASMFHFSLNKLKMSMLNEWMKTHLLSLSMVCKIKNPKSGPILGRGNMCVCEWEIALRYRDWMNNGTFKILDLVPHRYCCSHFSLALQLRKGNLTLIMHFGTTSPSGLEEQTSSWSMWPSQRWETYM